MGVGPAEDGAEEFADLHGEVPARGMTPAMLKAAWISPSSRIERSSPGELIVHHALRETGLDLQGMVRALGR